MGFLLHVYSDDKMHVFDMDERPSVSVGTTEKCDVVFNFPVSKIFLTVSIANLGVRIKSNITVEIEGRKDKSGVVSPGGSCIISRTPFVALVLFEKSRDSESVLPLTNITTILIGRSRDNNIIFRNRMISEHHAQIARKDGMFILSDRNTKNGTYVNGKRITETKLEDQDVISIVGYRILFQNSVLHFHNVGEDLSLKPGEKTGARIDREFPGFQRSPRLIHALPAGDVEIQAPPSAGGSPDINWLSVLIPPVGMIAVMAAVAYFVRSTTSLLFTAPMSLVSILVSVANYYAQKKKHHRTGALRLQRYEEYLAEVNGTLSGKLKEFAEAVQATDPTVSECFHIADNPERRLWERKPDDKDFMSIRVGTGEIPFSVGIKTPKKSVTLEDDSLLSKSEELKEQYQHVPNMPIVVDMLQHRTVGVVGDRAGALKLAKNMVVHAATHRSYEELKIITLFNRQEEQDWSWVRWLPHTWDEGFTERFLADSEKSGKNVLDELEETLKTRERELGELDHRESGSKLPFLLFVIADRSLINNHSIMRFLTHTDKRLGVGAVLLFDSIANLPNLCSMIVDVGDHAGTLRARDQAESTIPFILEEASAEQIDLFARGMAPVRLRSVQAESKLPGCVTFLQGYDVKTPEELNISHRWQKACAHRSMSVPIGVMSNGSVFGFDIWEKAHGPFGQVAGMPGSGKSEMMQTWILSMAVHFSPADVSFVLIDFKGTGFLLPFANMPHVAGTISDIDRNIRRNLIALESEMQRRKELFDSFGVQDIEGYLNLHRLGKATEACPFMMIVVDEFAEMKMQFPDFMPVIDSIFGIGRSLGMYCILMSQKPGGVVSPKVEANSRFRWCLRVANSGESREMLGRPEASKITVAGRSYVKVGDNEIFELIQSFWSGAPYNPNAKTKTVSNVDIMQVDLYGQRHKCETMEQTPGVNKEVKEIHAVIRYLNQHIKEHGISSARRVWTPKLKENLPLEDVLPEQCGFNGTEWIDHPAPASPSLHFAPPIGMIDDPYTQSQYPLNLKIAEEGHVAIYGAPGAGKTTLLQTLAVSLALSYSPAHVILYGMDFGSWGLKPLEALPHTGGIALDSEEEKIRNLAQMISAVLQERRQGFSAYGVSTVKAYSEAIGKPVPHIVLLVDNFAPVFELYPDLDPFFVTLSRSGSGYGVYLIASTTAISGISYRVAQNIKQSITLQMIDKTDYLAIIGRTDGLEPEKVPGRGMIRGNPPLEFQTASLFSAQQDTITRIKKLGAEMSAAWKGDVTPVIPVLPDIVRYGNFSHIPALSVPLGLTADMQQIFLSAGHKVALVSGTEKSGKTNVLKVLAGDYGETGSKTVFWLDGDGTSGVNKDEHEGGDDSSACSHGSPWKVSVGIGEIEKSLPYLSTISTAGIERDLNQPEQQQRQQQQRQQQPEQQQQQVVLIIDNLPALLEKISADGRKILEEIIESCNKTGICVYASGNYHELMLYYNRGDSLLHLFLQSNVSIVTGGKFSQHRYFTAGGLSYTEMETEIAEYFGYYTAKGKTVILKLTAGS